MSQNKKEPKKAAAAPPLEKAPSKAQTAYDTILHKILTNAYIPGTTLSERDLSEQLHISRTPVKDALNRLSFEGYVDLVPERGAVVSKVGLTDVLELYEIREALESHSARLAASRRSEQELEEMRSCIANQRRLFESGVFDNTEYEDNFHMCIARASFNHRLISYMEMIIRQCRRASIFQNQRNNQRIARSIDQHEVIFAAIENGDAEAAGQAMAVHLQDVITTTKALMCDYYFMYK